MHLQSAIKSNFLILNLLEKIQCCELACSWNVYNKVLGRQPKI